VAARPKARQYAIVVVILIDWLLGGFCAQAQGQGFTKALDPASFQMPAWLTDLSLGATESYDDNLYLSGVDRNSLPASYSVPPGSAAALKERSSFVTTVSPKIGVDFAPLLGNQNILQVFSLAYAPDFGVYHDDDAENYNAHRFPITVKGNWESFSFGADNSLSFINGSREGPTYPGGFLNAYSTCAPRERREQLNDRGAYVFQYDYDKWFVRPTVSLLYYDMMTKLRDVTGYQNYVGRYDVNGGADIGYRVEPQLAVTLGYRYGHQHQEQLNFSPYSSPSDYQRALVGIEGKPWEWLEVKIQGGPDFRSYPSDTATHITPINNKHPVMHYGEASLTATITTEDTLVFGYRQFQWVSQLGEIPYYDSTYELSYHRKLGDRLTLDLAGSILSSDYTSGNLPSSNRDDLEHTASAALDYSFNAHTSAKLAYSFGAGRNAQEGVANSEARGFDQNLISIGTLIKF